jgi:hypothetical protein
VIRYKIKKTTSVSTSDPECLDMGYTDGECRDQGWVTEKTTATYGPTRTVTRYDYASVHTNWTPGCVNYREFTAVKNGMTQSRVHGIFGARGKLVSSGSGGSTREYQTCEGNEWSYVEVAYDPRVWHKWRYIDWS